MAIKEALLALLGKQPANAYQLKKDFEATTGQLWTLNIGQVSTTLSRLRRDGLIESGGETPILERNDTESETGAVGAALWQLTEAGRASLDRWWSNPVTLEQRGRDELVMKIAFAVTIPGVDVEGLVQRQRSSMQQLLHDLTKVRRSLAVDDVASRLVFEHRIFATEAELRWLDTVDEAKLRSGIYDAAVASSVDSGANIVAKTPQNVASGTLEGRSQVSL